MPNMKKLRLADINLNIKIRELMGNFGYSVNDYKVIDSYPSDRERLTTHTLPTIVVTTNRLFGSNAEIGSNQWANVTFAIDVFSASDGQRDDLSYHLWQNLNEKMFSFYDFNDGYPDLTTAISYSGLTVDGNYYVDAVNSTTIAPPEAAEWDGYNHHQMLFGVLRLGSS